MGRLWSLGWIASHLFVVAMVVLMSSLGFWQLRRLDERREFNAATAQAMQRAPVDLADYSGDLDVPDHTAAVAAGVYLRDAEVRIGNRSSGGLPGSWLATPLRLDDGSVIAVARGWISKRELDASPTAGAAPEGVVTVEGLLFDSVSGARVAVTPSGAPPEISRMDLERFEEVSGVRVVQRWLRLRAQIPAQALPVPVPDPDLSDGPHLSYAFQWFFFSAGAVVVYALILRRAVEKHGGSVAAT